MELAGQGQHLARVSAAHSPFKQGSVLVECNDIPQPLCARRGRNYDHVRHIARPNTTTDGQLDSLQQSTFPPFVLQPFDRNFGQTTFDVATATASADRNLPNDEALRFQRTISIVSHKA
jgi:hypothetical protein